MNPEPNQCTEAYVALRNRAEEWDMRSHERERVFVTPLEVFDGACGQRSVEFGHTLVHFFT